MTTSFCIEIDWNRNGTWIDESSRTRAVKIRLGFEKPLDPVAAVGRCTITLDNSTRRFSPENSGGALYGKLLPRRPVRMTAESTGYDFSSGNLVTNGDFVSGETGWSFANDLTHTVSGGKMTVYSTSGYGVFYQDISRAVTVGDRLVLSFKVANSSSMDRLIAVNIHPLGYDTQYEYWVTRWITVPAHTAEYVEMVSGVAGVAWATSRLEFYVVTGSSAPGLTVDDISFEVQQKKRVIYRGWIESLLPGAGECVLECVDGVALLERQQVAVTHETTKTVASAIAALVSSAYTPPGTDYSNNGDALSHYGRNWAPENTAVLDALREVCQAVAGRFFVSGDGTATYRSRGDLQNASLAAALTISESSALDGLAVKLDVNSVVNECAVTVYPVETVSAPQVIWKARSTLRIAPGQSRVFYANFRDSDGQRCGAVDVVTPAATTDYLVNDGTGYNYTSAPAFSISTVTEATRMKITLNNTATGPLFVTFLQVRGKPLRVYDPITVQTVDSGSQNTYEKRSHSFDLPMQADPVFGQSMANYRVGRYKNPILQADHLLVQNRDVLGGVNVFGLRLFDKVVVSEAQTGITGLGHWITRLEYSLDGAGFRVLLGLERADDRQYWLLGRSGYSELGHTTRIGF